MLSRLFDTKRLFSVQAPFSGDAIGKEFSRTSSRVVNALQTLTRENKQQVHERFDSGKVFTLACVVGLPSWMAITSFGGSDLSVGIGITGVMTGMFLAASSGILYLVEEAERCNLLRFLRSDLPRRIQRLDQYSPDLREVQSILQDMERNRYPGYHPNIRDWYLAEKKGS